MTNPGVWSFGGHEIPRPGTLVSIDYEKREINSSVVVVGSGADEFLRCVYETTASDARGRIIDAAQPEEASFTYLPLRLGDIRGFATRYHLYGIRADDRLAELLEELVTHANGIVVARKEADDRNSVVGVAARVIAAQARRVPVAMLGVTGAEDREWVSSGGGAPVHVGVMDQAGVFAALKAVAREILAAMRS